MARHAIALCTVVGGVGGSLALAVSLGGEPYRKAYGGLSLVFSVHWVLILYLGWLAFTAHNRDLSLPRVKDYQADDGLLLVGDTPWLGIGSSVSVFHQDGHFERLVCNAAVLTVQQNRLVQLKLYPAALGMSDPDEIKRLLAIASSTLIIKPGANGVLSDD